MTRLKSVRTLVGAALAVLLSTFSLAPASAASAPVITWQGLIADGASFVYGQKHYGIGNHQWFYLPSVGRHCAGSTGCRS